MRIAGWVFVVGIGGCTTVHGLPPPTLDLYPASVDFSSSFLVAGDTGPALAVAANARPPLGRRAEHRRRRGRRHDPHAEIRVVDLTTGALVAGEVREGFLTVDGERAVTRAIEPAEGTGFSFVAAEPLHEGWYVLLAEVGALGELGVSATAHGLVEDGDDVFIRVYVGALAVWSATNVTATRAWKRSRAARSRRSSPSPHGRSTPTRRSRAPRAASAPQRPLDLPLRHRGERGPRHAAERRGATERRLGGRTAGNDRRRPEHRARRAAVRCRRGPRREVSGYRSFGHDACQLARGGRPKRWRTASRRTAAR